MPQNPVADKIMSDAKAELSKASTMSASLPKAAAPAPKPSAPVKAKAPTLSDELSAKGQMVGEAKKALAVTPPKMHRGGAVKQDGVYQLKKGEHVLTEEEAMHAHKHALMASGLGSMARSVAQAYKAGDSQSAAPAKSAGKTSMTKGQPVKIDMKHKAPADKKSTKAVVVRPEKNQAAQVKQQMER